VPAESMQGARRGLFLPSDVTTSSADTAPLIDAETTAAQAQQPHSKTNREDPLPLLLISIAVVAGITMVWVLGPETKALLGADMRVVLTGVFLIIWMVVGAVTSKQVRRCLRELPEVAEAAAPGAAALAGPRGHELWHLMLQLWRKKREAERRETERRDADAIRRHVPPCRDYTHNLTEHNGPTPKTSPHRITNGIDVVALEGGPSVALVKELADVKLAEKEDLHSHHARSACGHGGGNPATAQNQPSHELLARFGISEQTRTAFKELPVAAQTELLRFASFAPLTEPRQTVVGASSSTGSAPYNFFISPAATIREVASDSSQEGDNTAREEMPKTPLTERLLPK